MKIAILQMDVKMAQNFADCEQNFIRARELIDRALKRGADVAVLPEAFNMGFCVQNFKRLADAGAVRTKGFLSEISQKNGAVLIGGAINSRQDKIYNSAFIYQNGAEILRYDKIHAFSLARENKIVSSGDKLGICEIKFQNCAVKIGVVICYDLRFPELVRRLAREDISVLFLPAQWPTVREMHWRVLTQARAIENQIFLAAANGSGAFANGLPLAGRSVILDPWGERLAEAADGETILTADCDLTVREKIRREINVFADRRPDLYG